MSESLHPKYILQLTKDIYADNWGYNGGDSGVVWALRFYPSGLLLYCGPEEHDPYEPAAQYQPIYRYNNGTFSNLQHMKRWSFYFYSPVPKTYEFFDENDTLLYKIKYSDFTYDEKFKMYKVSAPISKVNNIYQFSFGIPAYILFIDHLIWQYNDSLSSTNPEIFPIYKDEYNNYYLNNSSINNDNYSFLTSVGALFEYDNNQDFLKPNYPMLSDKDVDNTGKKDQELKNSNYYNTIVKPQSEQIHYRYGINGKSTWINTTAIQNDDSYREGLGTNKYLLQKLVNNYKKDNPLIIAEWEDPSPYISSVGTPRNCFLLDDYYLLVTYEFLKIFHIYRIPANWHVSMYRRGKASFSQATFNGHTLEGGTSSSGYYIAISTASFPYPYAHSELHDHYLDTKLGEGLAIEYKNNYGSYTYSINKTTGQMDEDTNVAIPTVLRETCDFNFRIKITDVMVGAEFYFTQLTYQLSFDRFPWESTSLWTYIEKPSNPKIDHSYYLSSGPLALVEKTLEKQPNESKYIDYSVHGAVNGVFGRWIPDASSKCTIITYAKYPGSLVTGLGYNSFNTNPNNKTYVYGSKQIKNDWATSTDDVSAGMSIGEKTITANKKAESGYTVVGIYPDSLATTEWVDVKYDHIEGPILKMFWVDYGIARPQKVGGTSSLNGLFSASINTSEAFVIYWSDGTRQSVHPQEINHSEPNAITRIYRN